MNNDVDNYKSAMVVVAHADDAEFSCSGTVAKWCKDGVDVVYVIVTDGSKGTEDPGITSKELVDIRREEQINAGKILGLKDVVFLGYPDGYLSPTLEVRCDISREIRRYKPEVLITMNPTRTLTMSEYIGHPDHFAAGEAALSAVFPSARDHLTFPELLEDGFEPHKVREVLIVGHDSPDKWVNVTDTIDIAFQALKAHTSQIKIPEAEEYFMMSRSEAGKEYDVEYAERFKQFILR